jgi:thioredoxin-like negative regulator of GroEL
VTSSRTPSPSGRPDAFVERRHRRHLRPGRAAEQPAAEFAGQIDFVALNADENPEATRRYRVLSMPTLLLFEQGRVVTSIVGARPKSMLRQALTSSTGGYVNS